jgi:hypothetical protein
MAERLRENYQVYGQTALSLSSKAERFRIALLAGLPDGQVEAMGLKPVATVAEGLAWAGKHLPRGTTGYVIPWGSATLPVAAES